MLPYWTDYYGNPSSVHHFGQEAYSGLSEARENIAELLNCNVNNIIFTASGSESDNLAIRGVLWAARRNGDGNHIIISAIEHKAVSETAFQLQRSSGFEVTVLPVDDNGIIDVHQLEEAIRPDTALVSIMAANNEIGSLQPLEAIGEVTQRHGILFHTDAVQALAVSRWDFGSIPVDLMSIAPHKFYGPKGIGILAVGDGIELQSVVTGGGQENNRRAGTENVAFAVGAAAALRLALLEREDNIQHYHKLTRRLTEGLLNAFPQHCRQTGHPDLRIPNNASFAFKHISGNDIVFRLAVAGIAASSGSACLTGNPKPSAILQALGLESEWTKGGLRLTVGRNSTMDEAEIVLESLFRIIPELELMRKQYA